MVKKTLMPPSIPKAFYTLLLITGILVYVSWLALFGLEHWADPGLYAVTIMLIGFGVVGRLTYSYIEKKEQT